VSVGLRRSGGERFGTRKPASEERAPAPGRWVCKRLLGSATTRGVWVTDATAAEESGRAPALQAPSAGAPGHPQALRAVHATSGGRRRVGECQQPAAPCVLVGRALVGGVGAGEQAQAVSGFSGLGLHPGRAPRPSSCWDDVPPAPARSQGPPAPEGLAGSWRSLRRPLGGRPLRRPGGGHSVPPAGVVRPARRAPAPWGAEGPRVGPQP
jgi:hypothetical protein